MIVKITQANGIIDIFKTDKYALSTVKEMHPLILKAEVFTETGKKLKKIKRPFCWWYKHVTFKTAKIQDILKNIQELKSE